MVKPVNGPKGGAEQEEQNGRNRTYIEKIIGSELQKFKYEQKKSDEKEQTHVSDVHRMCTEDLMSGTKAMFALLPATVTFAVWACATLDSKPLLKKGSLAF